MILKQDLLYVFILLKTNMLFILKCPNSLKCTRCIWGRSYQRTACNTNLFFSFVLFSAVSFAIALCWFVSCLCFISVSIPLHLTPSLYGLPPSISLSVPMLQLSRKTQNPFLLNSLYVFILILLWFDSRDVDAAFIYFILFFLRTYSVSLPPRCC